MANDAAFFIKGCNIFASQATIRQMTHKEYNNGVKAWADDVYQFAVHCCGNSEDGKDAVQEAFAVLWKKREEVDAAKGKAYLLSVVYRQTMSRFRHSKVVQESQPLIQGETKVSPDERFDLREALNQALNRLPEVQRAALQLKDVEGYSCKEIAEILALNEQQVMTYLFRARVSMKKTMTALGYDNNDR